MTQFTRALFVALVLAASPLTSSHSLAQETETTDPDTVTAEAAPLDIAETPEQLLARLPDANFNDKLAIAESLARGGHPRAVPVLEALSAGLLFKRPGGTVVIGEREGADVYVDALTGRPIAGLTEAGLEKVTINNRLRRELRGLSARLLLMSPNLAIRRAAANAAFAAHDAETLPGIEQALASEEDGRVRMTLTHARAAIHLLDEATPDDMKLSAIQLLRTRGDQDALNVLSGISVESELVSNALTAAIASIRSSIAYWNAFQNIIYGLSLGSVLLLAAIGLAITFGVMGVINMAHGEMIMLGAYSTFMVQQLVGAYAPGLTEWSLLVAIPVAFAVSGLAGIAVERGVIRFLYGRPLETLLATWGVSLVMQQAVRTIFGPTNREVVTPGWMSGAFDVGLLTITYSRLWIIIFSACVLALLMVFLRYTHFGLQMRAVTQNRQMAAAMGIRTSKVDALTFGLGSGIAGIAGVALSQIDNVSPNLGQSYIIDSFMVVVFGGVGNLWGTLVGAMTLGIANKFLEPYAGAVLGKILLLGFIILFIQRRPRGLFALKGRAVEA